MFIKVYEIYKIGYLSTQNNEMCRMKLIWEGICFYGQSKTLDMSLYVYLEI